MVGYIKILNIPIGQKKKNILKRKKFTNWYYLFKINRDTSQSNFYKDYRIIIIFLILSF